jgi:hypothetical protein
MDNQNFAGFSVLTDSSSNQTSVPAPTQHVAGEPVVDADLQKMIADQLALLNVGGTEITYEHTVNPQIVIEQSPAEAQRQDTSEQLLSGNS